MGFTTLNAIIAVFIVAVGSVLQVDTLKCYQCRNCNTVISQQLLTCNFTLPVPPTEKPPTNPPTNGPGMSTTDLPSTDAPGSSTIPDGPQSSTVTDIPQSSAVTNIPQSSAVTDIPQSSTVTDIPQSSAVTNIPQSSAVTNIPQSSAVTDIPQSSAVTDIPQSTPVTDLPQSSIVTDPDVFKVTMVKRSIEWDEHVEEILMDDECFCENEYCNCGGRVFYTLYDDIKAFNLTYVCVTDTITNNGTTITNRGCAIKANTTAETCSFSSYSTNCTICESDGCNQPSSAISFHFSSLLLITVLLAPIVKM